METRQILIANNKTQRRYIIESAAETLGELKAQLLEQGIDFSGMTFTEGITKTSLVDDSSQLPTNVMFKGARTNNLVMLLTNPQKRVASGADDRKEAYRLVKENNLQEAVKQQFGRNFTQVSTGMLLDFVHSHTAHASSPALEETRQELAGLDSEGADRKAAATQETTGTKLPDVKEAPHAGTVEWFYTGIKAQYNESLLSVKDIVVLASLLNELALRLEEVQPKITDGDVNDMLNEIL